MMKSIALGALVLALLSGCATSTSPDTRNTTTKRAIPVELVDRAMYFGNPECAQGRISPDGDRVSWLAPRDGVMNIWVASTDDLSSGQFVTNDSYRGIRSHFWAPNSTCTSSKIKAVTRTFMSMPRMSKPAQ